MTNLPHDEATHQEALGAARARPRLRLAYFVHDLLDPAVARRLTMLAPQLEDAVVIGFHRAAEPPEQVAGWPTVPLGQTADARFVQRLASVAGALLAIGQLREHLRGRNAILSRQLETLPLALAARRLFAPHARVVHECLDVHRLLAGRSAPGMLLRWVEGRMLRHCAALVISSPAFRDRYLAPVHGAALPPTLLVENKVLAAEHDEAACPPDARPDGPPWRIGWFGVIRCRRSLLALAALCRALPGMVEVDIRGRPAATSILDFEAIVAGAPAIRFLGPYDRRKDLPAIYGSVHFTWAIDYFEAGGNSDWLLPNRLYEGSLHGAVPIALARVETGRWLATRGAGVLLEEPLEAALLAWCRALDPDAYREARAALAAIARRDLVDDGMDGDALASAWQDLPTD